MSRWLVAVLDCYPVWRVKTGGSGSGTSKNQTEISSDFVSTISKPDPDFIFLKICTQN
jgi:hypothetical protein